MPSGDVLTGGDLQARIVSDLGTASPELSELLRLIVISHTVYSLEFDPDVTNTDREAARQAVPESIGNVVQQEAIVRANEPIAEADLDRLNAYEAELRRLQLLEEPGLQFGLLLGAFLLNLSLLAVFGALVFFMRPVIYGSLSGWSYRRLWWSSISSWLGSSHPTIGGRRHCRWRLSFWRWRFFGIPESHW